MSDADKIIQLRKQWSRFLSERGVSMEDRDELWNITLEIFKPFDPWRE